MTSTIKVNTIQNACGADIIKESSSTITIGASGDTVTLASGASQSGFGRAGSVDWQTTKKTESFTAVSGEGYFVDTKDGTPNKNYAVTVASGTLYVTGGTGNVFNLDGSRTMAITLVKGKTYRFTQSDNTNDGHPLIISTSNSTTLGTMRAGIVSSGVTYYLDGSSNQTNYTNTTTFNAATTRYIEFQPQTTGTFYFACYVHGIGMGGAITSEVQTMTLPSSPNAGDIVAVKDYNGNFNTANLIIGRNGSPINGGSAADVTISTNGASIVLVYVDATQGWLATQDDESVFTGANFLTATGGTITECGNDKIHTFTGPGTFTVSQVASCASQNIVSYVVVAGGGGGGATASGSFAAGGGGAGGFREVKNPVTPYTASPLDGYPTPANRITVTATGYPITVGGGGAAGPPNSGTDTGTVGVNSTFSTITSAGGGGGGAGASPGSNGASGGSGGGGGSSPSSTRSGGSGNTPPVSPQQGSDGGDSTGGHQPASGGGGATAVGTNSTSGGGSPRAGGAGAGSSITSSPVTYSAGGSSGNWPGNPNSAGADNTGNGGGGGGGNGGDSGAGGSGIIIIRYKFKS